jgi:SAM-dependent methyltransferase
MPSQHSSNSALGETLSSSAERREDVGRSPAIFRHPRISKWIDRRFYGEYTDNWDDEIFRREILACVNSTSKVLDVGAGAGIVPEMNFRGLVGHISGIDPDPRVLENRYLDSAHVGYAECLPYEDEWFDVVFADNVLEHLPDPLRVLKEIRRVLKPDGILLTKTPNRWHYVPTIARLTPHWFHCFVNKWRGRRAEDTFPTLYRANSISRTKQLASAANLVVLQIETFEGRPEYLRKMWLLYMAGLLYEKIVNRARVFSGFRVVLVAKFRRPASHSPAA